MCKSIFKYIKIFSWILVTIIAICFIFFGGWRDATSGRIQRKAHDVFNDVEGVTKVELYLLMGDEEHLKDETFPIKPYGDHHPVYGLIDLTDDELQKFISIWRSQNISYGNDALCHHPAYGFRIYRDDKLISETSICWECNNFYVSAYPGRSVWYGFISHDEIGRSLLDFCDAKLPYKRAQEEQ